MTRFRSAAPALPVTSVVDAATFYSEVLQFHIAHRERAVAIVVRDDVEIHLWGATDRAWLSRSGPAHQNPIASGAESFLSGTGSCRILVSGIEELYERCLRAGVVHPNGPLGPRPWGATEFAALDPDGNCLTFTEPSAAD